MWYSFWPAFFPCNTHSMHSIYILELPCCLIVFIVTGGVCLSCSGFKLWAGSHRKQCMHMMHVLRKRKPMVMCLDQPCYWHCLLSSVVSFDKRLWHDKSSEPTVCLAALSTDHHLLKACLLPLVFNNSISARWWQSNQENFFKFCKNKLIFRCIMFFLEHQSSLLTLEQYWGLFTSFFNRAGWLHLRCWKHWKNLKVVFPSMFSSHAFN